MHAMAKLPLYRNFLLAKAFRTSTQFLNRFAAARIVFHTNRDTIVVFEPKGAQAWRSDVDLLRSAGAFAFAPPVSSGSARNRKTLRIGGLIPLAEIEFARKEQMDE